MPTTEELIAGRARLRTVNNSVPSPPPPPPAKVVRGKDPYLGLRFSLQLGQIEVAWFRECSPIVIETEMFEYPEGGNNTYTHKLPVRTKYSNITLKRGMDDTQSLYNWFVKASSGQIVRQNISIIIYDSQQNIKQRWDLQNAYPCKWTGPELKAESGAIAIETLEIAHEGLLPTGNRTASYL